jgi:hypothetical protein
MSKTELVHISYTMVQTSLQPVATFTSSIAVQTEIYYSSHIPTHAILYFNQFYFALSMYLISQLRYYMLMMQLYINIMDAYI